MPILLTLDYELFFGASTGSVRRCMIEPTDTLAAMAGRRGAQLTFFVDTAFLIRLGEYSRRFASARRDLDRIRRQLESMVEVGHDLQLHLHPHWMRSTFDGCEWNLDLDEYRLANVELSRATELSCRSVELLKGIAGRQPVAFRAGGWCIQPFQPTIRAALSAAEISVDSSVFAGGVGISAAHEFDFSESPQEAKWRFSSDPLRPDPGGEFLEVPIFGVALRPSFYWRIVASRLRSNTERFVFGDGQAIPWARRHALKLLARGSRSPLSFDASKIGMWQDKRIRAQVVRQAGSDDVVAIGHPKALSSQSIEDLSTVLDAWPSVHFTSFVSRVPEWRSE